ncbi:hypothetical protein Adu01nite_59330 [Paractinoplanes durhamensis]|uniref:Uncharacterized protein n=1 Tax=Paractinoplanes durhamensis TaxID=113563 RepID=A0ABQ3Z425_9ACTN|nr:hypothetical protein Adu01nite_59330 [Actinoplanes durhamensis]
MMEDADRVVVDDEVIGAGRDGAGKCAANAVAAETVSHFFGRGKVIHGGNGYSGFTGRGYYPRDAAADPS